ncbi:MAG: acetyl-CoA carboxylase biotin carboxylase subunit [Anaerolineae bacterium]|nr:MAG: acetyl-CoA carboxylase biotin carboxylase subunit [Anaerolineae bacterium]
MFSKILIANRGEIAVRVIRACRELGVRTVAVYSQADSRALHVRMADEAVEIGPPPPAESYLRGERIIEAALRTGAQAVHPGYGFLAENAAFARAVETAGLTFIGPPPEAIEAMGDKAQARARMQAAGVPVVPGYQGADDDASLLTAAQDIGYPLLVKAAAGGGGKGMRIAASPDELPTAIAAARREARHAFGDSRLLLERYIPDAHHIEFQVLADTHGNTLHLFERECSIQRRHQKIIEETPSPLLSAEVRQRMGMAAVQAARAVGYVNAGTVEFIFDARNDTFYFLEMNTRLQVEHPITELVTGIDLVSWQLRIASGERLPFQQDDLTQRGHAIECRLYAEDPANDFLPAVGQLHQVVFPGAPGVRLDTGITPGDEVTLHYDPLIAKLIVYAEDRPAALRKALAALRESVLLGLTTNRDFLVEVLSHPAVQAGPVSTTWVERTFGAWQPPQCDVSPEILVAAALTEMQNTPSAASPASEQPDPYSPWKQATAFRIGGAA